MKPLMLDLTKKEIILQTTVKFFEYYIYRSNLLILNFYTSNKAIFILVCLFSFITTLNYDATSASVLPLDKPANLYVENVIILKLIKILQYHFVKLLKLLCNGIAQLTRGILRKEMVAFGCIKGQTTH